MIGRQTGSHAATSATRLTGYRSALTAAAVPYDETLALALPQFVARES